MDVGLCGRRVGQGEKQLAALGCQFHVVADTFPHEPSRCSVGWSHVRHGGTSSCFWLRTTAGGRSSRGGSAGHSKGMERGSPGGQKRDLKAAFGLPDTLLTPTWTPSISFPCGTEKSWLKAEGPWWQAVPFPNLRACPSLAESYPTPPCPEQGYLYGMPKVSAQPGFASAAPETFLGAGKPPEASPWAP